MAYQDPKAHKFTESAREQYQSSYWRMPVRLVRGMYGRGSVLAELWKACPSITSILPILAVDTYPGKQNDAYDLDMKGLHLPVEPTIPADQDASPLDAWTGWGYISQRTLAALSGLNRETVGIALRALEAKRLLRLRPGPRAAYGGGTKLYFQLAAELLFPQPGERYQKIPARLFHYGTWPLLPTNASRHLYLVTAGVDSVYDETALLDSMGDVDQDDAGARTASLQEHRAATPVSNADLERLAGFGHRALLEAKSVLLEPIYGSGKRAERIALIRRGDSDAGNRVSWYGLDRRAWEWHWPVDRLNDGPAWLAQQRRKLWPALYKERDDAR